ncbi:MAG: hypothetical protein AB7F64_10015, partial [Gammaproteobacteria bacterium]
NRWVLTMVRAKLKIILFILFIVVAASISINMMVTIYRLPDGVGWSLVITQNWLFGEVYLLLVLASISNLIVVFFEFIFKEKIKNINFLLRLCMTLFICLILSLYFDFLKVS